MPKGNKREYVNLRRKAQPTRYEREFNRFERGFAQTVVQEAAGNMTEAAKLAGVHRTTLYKMCWKHGLIEKAA